MGFIAEFADRLPREIANGVRMGCKWGHAFDSSGLTPEADESLPAAGLVRIQTHDMRPLNSYNSSNNRDELIRRAPYVGVVVRIFFR